MCKGVIFSPCVWFILDKGEIKHNYYVWGKMLLTFYILNVITFRGTNFCEFYRFWVKILEN